MHTNMWLGPTNVCDSDRGSCDTQEAMGRSMDSRGHHYILEPVCASALLKRNCSKEPLRSRHTPRIECDIQLETIPLKLSQVPLPPGWFVLSPSVGDWGEGACCQRGLGTPLCPSGKKGTREVCPELRQGRIHCQYSVGLGGCLGGARGL